MKSVTLFFKSRFSRVETIHINCEDLICSLIPLSTNEQSVMINKESSSKDMEVREDFLKLPNITFLWILRANHFIGIPYWLPPIQVSRLFYFGAFRIQLSILEFSSFYMWVYWLHLAYALFTVYWRIEKGSP